MSAKEEDSFNNQVTREMMKMDLTITLQRAHAANVGRLIPLNDVRFKAENGVTPTEQAVYRVCKVVAWLHRADFLIYLESSKQQVNKRISEIVDNSDLRRYISEYI